MNEKDHAAGYTAQAFFDRLMADLVKDGRIKKAVAFRDIPERYREVARDVAEGIFYSWFRGPEPWNDFGILIEACNLVGRDMFLAGIIATTLHPIFDGEAWYDPLLLGRAYAILGADGLRGLRPRAWDVVKSSSITQDDWEDGLLDFTYIGGENAPHDASLRDRRSYFYSVCGAFFYCGVCLALDVTEK